MVTTKTTQERRARGHVFQPNPAMARRLDTLLIGGPFGGIRVRLPIPGGTQRSEVAMMQPVEIKHREVTACTFGCVLTRQIGTARYEFMCEAGDGPRHQFVGYINDSAG